MSKGSISNKHHIIKHAKKIEMNINVTLELGKIATS